MSRIVVGMSGGVDSSVAALLLKRQGHEVIGMFMKNWEETDGSGVCHATQDYEDVQRVCSLLDIPCYPMNFVNEYRDRVFNTFLNELKLGHTPNPDILCNREIKFDLFFNEAMKLGADFLATGHYARTNAEGQLLKGLDPGKDQSYFLYTLTQPKLKQVLFPIGDLLKKDVRHLAKEAKLPVAEKKDSTGICFIGKRDFKPFVAEYLGYQKGDFITPEGETIGRHDGAAFYTIGQRKGLGIGGPGEAWFVAGKDIQRNTVVVVQGESHPALFNDQLMGSALHWISEMRPELPLMCKAKIRYRQEEQSCILSLDQEGDHRVKFDQPQRAITPKQSIVFYDGDLCLGGGIIEG